MRKIRSKRGFTLVELSLSIAFIAILSITIALIINDAISTYRRGLTLNQINTVGMDLVDDIRAAIQNSPASIPSVCKDEDIMGCISITKRADVELGGETIEDVPVLGAFCTGRYSYIWNTGYFFMGDDAIVDAEQAKLSGYDGDSFRLIKIRDDERAVCNSELDSENVFDGIDVAGEDVVTVLLSDDGANSLALYDFSVSEPAISDANNSTFYSMSFILGTVQGGVNVMSNGNFCTAPEDLENAGVENFDYCAINKFNFAAQANGG
ncbi:type II secretion system protein [Candidatus Saccharibacteria bacterium]|nr:type II secretion system protein [Candidatus Saccharibacteria bacterium]